MTVFDLLESNIAAATAESLDTMFWPPSRLGVDSAWYGHVPFAHWLVAALRPASIVELGSHNGVSYAAFCEAVLRCNLGARALAVDTWQGDEHAGFYDDSVYQDLSAFHDRRYAAFSTLLRSTFDNALQFVPDGSIDLLHIDGRHRYEDVSHDFSSWRPKLSQRGVVLFHDTNVHEGDFGVWRLWSEIRHSYAGHFEFLHGHGLGVLLVGDSVGEMEALFRLNDGSAINRIRDRFATLGERWIAAYELRRQKRATDDTLAEVQRVAHDLEATRDWAQNAQNEVNRLFPQNQRLTERGRLARAELAQARYDLSAYQLREKDLKAALAQNAHALARSEQNRMEAETRRAASEAQAADAVEQRTILERHLDFLEQQRRAIATSRSWRLTAPLRRASRLGGGHAPLLDVARPALPPPPDVSMAEWQTPDMKMIEIAPAILPPPGAEQVDRAARRRVLFISGEDHTPGHIYRVERYVDAARRAGYDARAMSAAPVGPADLAGIDVVILWRVPYSSHIEGIVTVTHEQGGFVVFDVDDLMFRPELAVAEVIDGIRSQNFSEVETQGLFKKIGATLRACDLVTCPTEELAQEARRLGKPAQVLPNGFDRASHDKARVARREWALMGDDLLRIGYAGGSRTHQRDFAVAVPAIVRLLREMPDLRLTVFRDPSSGEGLVLLDEFPELDALQDRIEWRDMVGLEDLPNEIARFTVNIAPLEPGNPFCEAKSELKFFEGALAGVPTVASPTGPFARAIRHGETGFLAETDEEWYQALHQLLHDPAARTRMGQAAYHVSLGRFGPEARADLFGLMVAQMQGGAEGAAAFERARYRAHLGSPAAPHIPEIDVIFSTDRKDDASVTVIVPVFNYADYVPEALASVAAQSLEKLDLVVVEDRSTDDSREMILAWAQMNAARFNRLRIVRHKENSGLGFGRNTGFALAETEYVLPLDADNRLRPDACETLLAQLSTSDAAYAYPRIQQFQDKAEVQGQAPYSVLRLQTGNYIDAMALVRKSAWASVGGYDHVRFGWEDFDFWCRLAEHGFFGIAVPKILADYRVHGQSMLHISTEVKENRTKLVEDMRVRHPWLQVT